MVKINIKNKNQFRLFLESYKYFVSFCKYLIYNIVVSKFIIIVKYNYTQNL